MADNELYLTKGEAKAVREGSNTVDMTDNQMRAMGRAGFGISDSGLKELIMRLLGGMGEKAGSKLSGIAELMEQARDVTGDNKMVGEEVLTEGTTYDYDVDGNPTTFSFSETEEMSNKNGGIMNFALGGSFGGKQHDMSDLEKYKAESWAELQKLAREGKIEAFDGTWGTRYKKPKEAMEWFAEIGGDADKRLEEIQMGITYDNMDTDTHDEIFTEIQMNEAQKRMNKNGGIMNFAAGGPMPPDSSSNKPEVDPREAYITSSNTYTPSNIPDQIQVGTNPHTGQGIFVDSSNVTNKNKEDKYNQIVDSAGTGNINMNEIVDFREESGMDGTEYSEFLNKIKERSGNEAFYDAGFTSGPGQMVENWIKSGGFLGNILKSVLGAGKDAGVAALDKVTDFKEYLSNFGDGVMANQAVEEFTEVQEPITGYEDSSDVFKLPLTDGKQKYKFADYYFNPNTAQWGDTGNYLKMDPNKGLYVADTTNPSYFNMASVEQGSYDDSAMNSNFYGGRSPTDELYANTFTMNPSNPNSFPLSRQYNQMWKDNMLSDGGGLFPQMTPQDPLMNSFNKTPLSVLERDNGGVTRQQYMQQYAPKTAAQMLGIVETYDEEGIMGV